MKSFVSHFGLLDGTCLGMANENYIVILSRFNNCVLTFRNPTISIFLLFIGILFRISYRNCFSLQLIYGMYSMAKCHECTLVINQSYWFEILQTIIKSFEGWGQVIIFLLLALTLLVFSVSISSVYKSL